MVSTCRHQKDSLRPAFLVCLLLAVSTLTVYAQVSGFAFLNYDDDAYVTDNAFVQRGLTLEGIRWAFTALHEATWQPLVWLSFMLGCELYGLHAGLHHLTNLLLHLINVLLVFATVRRMTGALWASGFVAALVGVHPLHVESVAWITERKDVLCLLFWLLSLWSYAGYVRRPGIGRYLAVLVFYLLGLMSKPMLVTLPCVLLLLDWWPSGRLKAGRRLIWEKIPLFACAAASCLLTYYAQAHGGAVAPLEAYGLDVRIANALVAYVKYMLKMLLPFNLAVLYPHPGAVPLWQAAGAGLLLLGLSAVLLRAARRYAYLGVGWLWYLGTLVPVIGIVQIGAHAMADRFAYIPLIGLYIIIAWGIPDLFAAWRHRTVGLSALAAAALTACMLLAWHQTSYWKNSITLFEHALQVTPLNAIAHNGIGCALTDQGREEEAIRHYRAALAVNPAYEIAHNNLANALERQHKTAEAAFHYTEALRIDPGYAQAHNNLGTLLAKQGRLAEAVTHFSTALRINPEYVNARYNLGMALARQGDNARALQELAAAMRQKPDMPGLAAEYAKVHNDLGVDLSRQGKTAQAISHFESSLKLQPDNARVHYNLSLTLAEQGNLPQAIAHCTESLRLKPDDDEAHANLGALYFQTGQLDAALASFQEAVRIRPDSAEHYNSLGIALAKKGLLSEAVRAMQTALQVRPDYQDARQNLHTLQARLNAQSAARD
jgi:tetratricopeptide (TPR) repeat protein